MDIHKLTQLLAEHQPRSLPDTDSFVYPAAEVAAVLKEQQRERQRWARQHAEQERSNSQLLAQIMTLLYLLDQTLERSQPAMEQQGLVATHREMRIAKDQLVALLNESGLQWHAPLGEPFEGDLPVLVSVDGWRQGPEYAYPQVIEVRTPIILRDGIPIKEGSVLVGAPISQKPESPT